MPAATFYAEDSAGNRSPLTLTLNVPIVGEPAWLTTFADIHDAIYDGEPVVYIGDGIYDIPHDSGLYLARDGQRIIGQSAVGTVLRATGTRGQMRPAAGGLGHDSTKGVLEVAAHGVEIGNLTLTQTLSQSGHAASDDQTTYPVAGIWAGGNDWYFHDLIIKRCSFGMQLWLGAAPAANVLKRAHRVIVTDWGYRGQLHGHSGYAVYEQCTHGTVEMTEVVAQTGTDMGFHHYGSFSFGAQFDLTGCVVIDSGNPSVTGTSGGDTQMYMAKTERLKVIRSHSGVMWSGTHYANNKVGYGSGYNPKRFEADDTWHINKPDLANQTWLKNSNLTWPEGFVVTNTHNYRLAADRPSFAGLKPLGGSWFVHYGTPTPPAGYELVPGAKHYPAPAFGQPPMLIVRPV